ncbi:uncharacterized protein DNG_09092 [Cephalotrichum gorgonifer]|uniref:Uncharacterized protein n=1 Tax=Cephalotrichum gorgonifer TaxID=2041049 RepID=A0AAE8SZ39_9PEZI|nr:uncharacterized protein DNG_09092 [Cephalotrichum gorgonifer]
MSLPVKRNYRSPLEGFESASTPLSEERNEDGKSFVNPPREGLSDSYEKFGHPLDNGRRGGFDVHIYYFQENEVQTKYAKELWERIRREFPELRVYKVWDKPIGPHPIAMFEVNLFTPAQFGAFIPWLSVWRGPLSALVHPNSIPEEGESPMKSALRDHSERAIWLGEKVPLDFGRFLDAIEAGK